jgi:hypothetical protein
VDLISSSDEGSLLSSSKEDSTSKEDITTSITACEKKGETQAAVCNPQQMQYESLLLEMGASIFWRIRSSQSSYSSIDLASIYFDATIKN